MSTESNPRYYKEEKVFNCWLGVDAYACKLQHLEGGDKTGALGNLALYSKFEASLVYLRLSQNKQINKQK